MNARGGLEAVPIRRIFRALSAHMACPGNRHCPVKKKKRRQLLILTQKTAIPRECRISNILAAIFPVFFIRAHNRLCRRACILRLSYIANLSQIFIPPKQAFPAHSAQIQLFSNPLKFALTYWHSPTKNRNPKRNAAFKWVQGVDLNH